MTEISKNTINLLKALSTKKGRKSSGLFLVEGIKMCMELPSCNMQTDFIVISDSAEDEARKLAGKLSASGSAVYSATDAQIRKISDTQTPQGIIAAVKINDEPLVISDRMLILNGVSDPGNVGTIIRTADWFGFDSIILDSECADIYNPKVVRSTMGSIFRTNIHRTDDLPNLLKNELKDHEIFAAVLDHSESIIDCKPTDRFGIILGNESQGISKKITELSDRRFRIPGIGQAESLNVASAAAVSLYHFSDIYSK
ncbi:MAG: RNA methyltransferase [Candidatus Kapabacteria bacterium]|jgi:TrmH family RNA methyltransferase|nr:RNA methyltransferase [Candidatus Kapabacteria bacterium]